MAHRLAPRLVVSLLALALVPAAVHAGPPLLCFPMETGGAPSLPWGSGGWNEPRADYDRARLAADTVALLGPASPVLARMETLRRAVLYAATDAAAATALFDALRERAGRGGEAKASALARFDLGYALEAASQARAMAVGAATLAAGTGRDAAREDGYALVRDAIAARGGDPEMEYAAALITISARGTSDAHLRRAAAGAKAGSPLARTIAAHRPIWGGRADAVLAAAR